MDVNFIQNLVPQRVRQRGFDAQKSYGEFRHILIPAQSKKQIEAFNQLWFLIGAPSGVRIRSNYGDYDLSNLVADEQQHEHTDQIEIENPTLRSIEVKFYQVYLNK